MQAVVRLPFANVQRLAAAAQEADPKEWRLVSEEEVMQSASCHQLCVLLLLAFQVCLLLFSLQLVSWQRGKTLFNQDLSGLQTQCHKIPMFIAHRQSL